MSGKLDDLVATLRHLVELNEPENGGPYQGFAAAKCVEAMREAATAIATLQGEGDFWKADAERQTVLLRKAEADLAEAMKALEPSADTKEAYEGSFSFGVTLRAGNQEDYRRIEVPWATIKEIMAAILARSRMEPGNPAKSSPAAPGSEESPAQSQ